MEQVLANSQPKTKAKRVWEVDFLRGFCMLFVIWDHLMFDFAFLFSFSSEIGHVVSAFARDYWGSGIRAATHDYFVGAFVVTSGLSCVFSRNDFKKSLKVLGAGLLITIVTNAFAKEMGRSVIINFGVLHMLGLCGLIWAVLKSFNCPDWLVGLLAVACLALGFYFQAQNLTEFVGAIWLFENRQARHWSPGDFFPLMPWLGWFFVGVLVGNLAYKNKKTKLAFVNEKYVSPVTFVGRHSLLFYLLSQAIAILLLFALTGVGLL